MAPRRLGRLLGEPHARAWRTSSLTSASPAGRPEQENMILAHANEHAREHRPLDEVRHHRIVNGTAGPERLSSQLLPIWWVVVIAIGAYAGLHYLASGLGDAPCQLKELTLPWLAVAPGGVFLGLTIAGLLFAAVRRPLGVIKARICAHVARVLLALALAGFSFALVGVTIQTLVAFAPRPPDTTARPEPVVANAPGDEAPQIRIRRLPEDPAPGRRQPEPAPDTCEQARGFIDDHPFWSGVIFTVAIALLGGALVVLIKWGNPRAAARIVGALPSRRWRWIATLAVLAWPTVLVIQSLASAGIVFFAGHWRLLLLLGSGGAVVWWAIDRVFSGLALMTAAAREFDEYVSSPHASYQAKIAAMDRADVLVFSDMHLAALSDGHPLRTMDSDTESFDDATSKLVTDLLARVKPSAIIVAGDVTDTGHASSWERAAGLLKRPDIPTYIAPGNHDVHFRWLTPELVDRRGATWLVLREAFAMDRPRDSARDSVGEDELARNIDAISPAGRRVEGTRFPILHTNVALRLLVLVLDSNRRPPDSPLTNAIGLVGADQLRDASALLQERPGGYGLIIVLHHHVVPPPDLEHHTTLRCEDAAAVLSFAAEQEAIAIIHGHKHMPYTVRHTVRHADGEHELWIISCGSTLYDAVGPRKDDVRHASAVGLSVHDGTIADVVFFPAGPRGG